MERLTKRNEVGYGVISDVTIENGIRRTILTPHEASKIQEALNRLAAYEDTGLTPEEISRIKVEIDFDQMKGLKDLLQAEKDGRLVVMVGRCRDCVHWLPPHIEKDGKFVRELKRGELVALSDGINVGAYCSRVAAVFVHGFRDGEPSLYKTMAWMREDDFCSNFERKEADNG